MQQDTAFGRADRLGRRGGFPLCPTLKQTKLRRCEAEVEPVEVEAHPATAIAVVGTNRTIALRLGCRIPNRIPKLEIL